MKKPLALLLCSSLFFSFSSFAQNILGNLTPQFKAKIVIEDQKANQNAKTTNNKVTKEQNNKVNDALKGKKLPQDVSTTIKEKIQNTSFWYCRKIICNSKIEIRTSIWYTLYYKNTGYSIWQRQIS